MKNEILADLGPEAWIVFVCLWMLADRDGRLEDRPRRIKAQAVPFWDWDVDQILEKLWKNCFISRYENGSRRIIQIINWEKYQRPNPKEAPSELPSERNLIKRRTPGNIGRKNGPTGFDPDAIQMQSRKYPDSPRTRTRTRDIYSNPVKAAGRGSGGNQSLGNPGTPNGVTSPRESDEGDPKPEPKKRGRPRKGPKPEVPKKPPIQHEPPPDLEHGQTAQEAPRKPAGSEGGPHTGVRETPRTASTGPELTQGEFKAPTAASSPSGAFLWPYTRNQVDGVRVVLESYAPPGLPRPDDGICRAVLDVAQGAGVDDIEAVVRSVWLRGKFRSAYSWGFFPQVLRGRFRRAS